METEAQLNDSKKSYENSVHPLSQIWETLQNIMWMHSGKRNTLLQDTDGFAEMKVRPRR